MTKKIRIIPNPNKINHDELDFINKNLSSIENHNTSVHKKNDKYQGRMISMSDSFYKELNQYLFDNPTEGNRSSFIVRIVADYIKSKT